MNQWNSIKILVSRLLLICVVIFEAACSSSEIIPRNQSINFEWKYTDLRVLDPPDSPDPHTDIVAVYARQSQEKLLIRLDFLDAPQPQSFDLYIVYRSLPGISKTSQPFSQKPVSGDLIAFFPANGLPRLMESDGTGLDPGLLVEQDNQNDFSVYQINIQTIKTPLDQGLVELILTDTGSNRIIDSVDPFSIGALPPAQASLILEFWNVFPAYSAAQALRNWDGAHTGPLGQRHGVTYLIQGAITQNIPITLLDLKIPRQIGLLDYQDKTVFLRELEFNRQLILPDVIYGDSFFRQFSIDKSIELSRLFGYSTGQTIFDLNGTNTNHNYTLAFGQTTVTDHMIECQGIKYVPLPQTTTLPDTYPVENQSGKLSLEDKENLLNTALSNDPTRVVIIGGDLRNSIFGDSVLGIKIFTYIKKHPWIKYLGYYDLSTMPARHVNNNPFHSSDRLASEPTLNVPDQKDLNRLIYEKTLELNRNPITDQALFTYLQLTTHGGLPEYNNLSKTYSGLVFHFLEAAKWLENPRSIETCDVDINYDKKLECIYSTENIFTSYNQEDGRIILAFYRSSKGVFQWIGPQSQLAIGLSDPSEWQQTQGTLVDPSEIPGAFADYPLNERTYTHKFFDGRLLFSRNDGQIEKNYKITSEGITVDILTKESYSTKIPLVPGHIEQMPPGWKTGYNFYAGDDSYLFRGNNLDTQLKISIQGAHSNGISSLDSINQLDKPEDPNLDYPAGHYLPLPMSLISIAADNDFSVNFSAIENPK